MTLKLIKKLEKVLDTLNRHIIARQAEGTLELLNSASLICNELHTLFSKSPPAPFLFQSLLPVEEMEKKLEQLRRISMKFAFQVAYQLLTNYHAALHSKDSESASDIKIELEYLTNKMQHNYSLAMQRGLDRTEGYIDFPQDWDYLKRYYLQIMEKTNQPFQERAVFAEMLSQQKQRFFAPLEPRVDLRGDMDSVVISRVC